MTPQKTLIAYNTLARREVGRIIRIWSQTLLPPIITTTLYFLVFGTFLGSRVGEVEGTSYVAFIVPGLVMMSLVTAAFSNTSFSYFSSKFQRTIEELAVSPMPWWVVALGYLSGGIFRGVAVGLIVTIVSLFFTPLSIERPFLTLGVAILVSVLMSLIGLIQGILAKSFDTVNIIPTFVLTPLVYLGGVFYPISTLAEPWRSVSLFNPIVYMVDAFRAGFTWAAGVHLGLDLLIIGTLTIVSGIYVMWLFKTGRANVV